MLERLPSWLRLSSPSPLSRRSALPSTVALPAGRLVLLAIAVGVAMGLVACAFHLLLEAAEHALLGGLAGYQPLHAAGEKAVDAGLRRRELSPAMLIALPALGGLGAGLLAHRFAPEIGGGGGQAFLDTFHRRGGVVRRRVGSLKMLATAFTLGTGGSGGREGPTMLVGAAFGSLVGRLLNVSPRERRIFVVAGTAAGMAAIFRTPLGAALLAVEVLYRDDFEADALIPSVLASVTAYSIFVLAFPSAGFLFAHATRYPFEPTKLPLFALFAPILCVFALAFEKTLHRAKKLFGAIAQPWLRPAVGGLLLGAGVTLWVTFVNPRLGLANRGLGLMGSGYGAAQGAITGGDWLPEGWAGVLLLAVVALAKILATSLTVGSGGSAGDFAPSLVIGALAGGAFGRAAQLLVDPTVDPGAFALVGMGTFYGGLAHVPVASLVMVCEMAGNYDLLVPLMLCEALAFVLLRRVSLFERQPSSRFESPVHAGEESLDVLKRLRVSSVRLRKEDVLTVRDSATPRQVFQTVVSAAPWQDTFPVTNDAGKLVGLLSADIVRSFADSADLDGVVVAADVMGPPVVLRPGDDLHVALERMLDAGLRELPVVGDDEQLLGLLDEADVTRGYHDYMKRLREGGTPLPI